MMLDERSRQVMKLDLRAEEWQDCYRVSNECEKKEAYENDTKAELNE